MNIKTIFKSQSIRHKLMRLGSFIPDKIMISLQYWLLLHRWPNLKNPQRFTEWIQLYKMKYRNLDMLICVDKYKVRDYVRVKGCGCYLNEVFQACEKAEQINFDVLPKKFVIKTTNGGNGDNVLIVKDKSSLIYHDIIPKVNSWLKKNYSNTSREWAYSASSAHPMIIVEKYLEDESGSLNDYKFYCFNGTCRFLSVDYDRYGAHTRAYFNQNWNYLSEVTGNYSQTINVPELPTNINSMRTVAEKLAQNFPFVRVDLYNVNGRIIFGELTFYPASGYSPYNPDNFDFELGKYFNNF